MSQGHDIDPQLRDAAQHSRSTQEDASRASTSSPSIRLPPASHSPLQVQPSQQDLHHYAPYSQSQNGPYHHDYYGPSLGKSYGQSESAIGHYPFPTTPAVSHPGLQYISKTSADSKRLRACEACRGLKVRCESDPSCGSCKRCLKSGRKCEITAPSRKRQKKTDSRVSELEKQLSDIQAQLRMSGQIASDGEGASYSDRGSMLIKSPYRVPTSQQPYPQPGNGKSAIGSSAQTAFGDPHNGSQKLPQSDIDRNLSSEGPVLYSHQTPLPTLVTPPSTSLQEAAVTDIRTIANSVDLPLAKNLMAEYVRIMLPQNPNMGAVLVDRVKSLQRLKPILFIAIMMLMLQTWCKDIPKVKNSITKSEGSKKGNQALHLLSEVAMGNSEPEGDKEEKQGGVVAENGSGSQQYLANVFVKKLLSTDDKDAKTEMWFEEMIQGFG